MFHLPSFNNKVEGPEYEELVRLHDSVYDQAVAWFTSLKDNMKVQILNHFGSMPGKEPEPQVIKPAYLCSLILHRILTLGCFLTDFCCGFVHSRLLLTQFWSVGMKHGKQYTCVIW